MSSIRPGCTGIPRLALTFLIPLLLQANLATAQYIPNQPRASPDDSSSSTSREIYIAGHDDFCLFGPGTPGTPVSQSGQDVVSWCNKAGHNTRLIPEGTLSGVTYVKAKNWVQVSGVGDFSKVNVKKGDWGGQYDSGEHKPDGAKVMGGEDHKEASSWVTLISPDLFCFRACFGDASYCPTTFADKGCYDLLSNGVGPDGTFQSCTSEDGLPPAQQGDHAPEWVGCQSGDAPAGSKSESSDLKEHISPEEPAATIGTSPTSTSWVGVPTCIPCEGGESNTDPAKSTSAPTGSASSSASSSAQEGTIQQGVTKVGEGDLVAAESGGASPTTPPSSSGGGDGGKLILKRDEKTTTSNGQCCFTTWTPTVIGGSGPTGTPAPSGSGSAGNSSGSGVITGINPSNVSATGLITKPSGSGSGAVVSASGTGNASITGGGANGTGGNGTGNDSESAAIRKIYGVDGPGMGLGMLLATLTTLGGWFVL